MTSWPNYVNDAKVWLPMTAATHDPTNVRTLDVSGNGLHYRFGDGATANTFPIKNSGQRGYILDGNNDYLEGLANQNNAITQGTWAVFYAPRNQSSTQEIVSHFDALGNVRVIILTTTTSVGFYCGDATFAAGLTLSIPIGQANFIAGYRTTDGFRRLYMNGVLASPNNTGVTLPGNPTTLPRLGIRYNGINALAGEIFWYGHWEYALSELQLRDLEARLRRQLNDI